MRNVGVAILGLGTVGGGAYQIITKNHDHIADTYNVNVEIKAVLDKNEKRLNELNVPEEIRANDIMEIVSDPDIDIVVELIGGSGIAKKFVETALENGKTVVTANKELIAKNFAELNTLAEHNQAGLYYEASCVGGTPVIRMLFDSMQANVISGITGIVNGTTNYILTKMTDEGVSYEDALKEAQGLGYAEANPTADVEGFDASYKLSILSSLAFSGLVSLDGIFREGISEVKKEDIAYGKELGYTVKLLAIGKRDSNKIEARVHPTFIKNDNPLASVKGSFNAFKLVGDAVGDIMLYGRGAGALPTGSAIVSDIVYASQYLEGEHFYITSSKSWEKNKFAFTNDFSCSYYVRMKVEDKAGVLAKVGQMLADCDVSLSEVIQKGYDENGYVPLIITTHKTLESAMQSALKKIKECQDVKSVEAVIRIEK